MTRKRYSRTFLIFFALSLVTFLFSLYKIDPRNGVLGIVIFLVSLFFLTTTFVTFVSFYLTNKVRNNEAAHNTMSMSVRRGGLTGIYIVIALALSALELLTWWDAILLAFSLVLFELYFMSGKERMS